MSYLGLYGHKSWPVTYPAQNHNTIVSRVFISLICCSRSCSLPADNPRHETNHRDMQHLICPDGDVNKEGTRRVVCLPVDPSPPVQRFSGIDDHVKHRDRQSIHQREHAQHCNEVDRPVRPRGGVGEHNFVRGHPLILKQPIGDQMSEAAPNEQFSRGCHIAYKVTYIPISSLMRRTRAFSTP